MNVIVPAEEMHVFKNIKIIDMKAEEINSNFIWTQKI